MHPCAYASWSCSRLFQEWQQKADNSLQHYSKKPVENHNVVDIVIGKNAFSSHSDQYDRLLEKQVSNACQMSILFNMSKA